MQDLQEVADDLFDRLGRPVTIDDRHGRLLVHSSHATGTDEARERSILARRVSDELVDWTRARGVERAAGSTLVPNNPELGFSARLFVPLRCKALMLGYLSVLDIDGTIADGDVEVYESAGTIAAAILYRERLLHEVEHAHERTLVHDLLFGEADACERASEQLVREGLLTTLPVAAIVLCWEAPVEQLEQIEISVRRGLARARRTLPPGSSVEFARADWAVLLVHPARLGGSVREFAHRAATSVADEDGGALTSVDAGFGAEVARLVDASTSHEQALRALRVADRLPRLPRPVGWCDLGVNRMLSLLSTDDDVLAEIPTSFRELTGDPELLRTVERYLELGGDIKATSSQLSLHRTSVYARLEKAERIAGVTFKSGEDRLALHLSLRLLRLSGGVEGPASGPAG
ncbi:MAG: helix-turn-helix domain-containing protein [Actinobacteria bacterium]|nr:helix-turn-helix domain-containing protein [Actinomycetota bacterium]